MTITSPRVVAIHQPNFFPWMGYFNKIARADLFVLHDALQYPKGGSGNLLNRVEVLNNHEPRWITVPIVRSYHGTRLINETEISNTQPWRNKILNIIRSNYGKAPHFADVYPLIEDVIQNSTGNLAEFNVAAIKRLSESLHLDTSKFLLGSSLDVTSRATDMLVDVVKAVGGTGYLCGKGAAKYQEDEKFAAAGIDLVHQNFTHPVYGQYNTGVFVPGLSIIDVLMNCGVDKSGDLVRLGT